jgi:uncharacterized protein (TIGR02996 family)
MASRGEALLRAVYENLDDDGARRVYADWLVEQGDPRGELIALQVARATQALPLAAERREVELLWKHGRAWLAPFARQIGAFRFERGFLVECELKALTKKMVGHASWATVRSVRLVGVDGPLVGMFLSHPAMRSLREVTGVGVMGFATLCSPGMGAGIERLEVVDVPRVPLERAKATQGLQKLRELKFR